MKDTIKKFQIVYMILSAILFVTIIIIMAVTLIGYGVDKSNAEKHGGMNDEIGLTISFEAKDLHSLAIELAKYNYADKIAEDENYLINNPYLVESAKATILAKYRLIGNTYWYNLYPVIPPLFWFQTILPLVFGLYCFLLNYYCYYIIKKKNEYSVKLAVISIFSLNIPSGVLISILSSKEE